MSDSSAEPRLPVIAAPSELPQTPTMEQPPKRRGRERLVSGLHRMTSAQSLTRGMKKRARTYSGTGRGSISCISLNSPGTPYVPSIAPEISNGYSTAPTSAVTTPGAQLAAFDERSRRAYVTPLTSKSSVALSSDPRLTSNSTPGITEVDEDYFSRPIATMNNAKRRLDFWQDMPTEIKMAVLSYLTPREIVQCSVVSKAWHSMCFDGQLWSNLDTPDFFQEMPADALVKVITSAGPFVRDLNLRGCVQLRERWHAKGLSDICTNLENFSLEGCRIDRTSIHNFLYRNSRLVHINLSGLACASNTAMKIIAQNCPKLEHLNVSWCNNIDTQGLKKIVDACSNLKDLRAGEIRGWDDVDFCHRLFKKNTLERLILMNCDSLTNQSFAALIEGKDSEIDPLNDRPMVPPRQLKHLDLMRCRGLSDEGVRKLVNNIPNIEGLSLSKCQGVTDATLLELLPTTPMLTHLDLEEVDTLSNAVLQALANAPCAKRLRHLSISYCENMGDAGMLPVLKSCTNLRSLEMDNTRISDLVLAEAAAMFRQRTPRTLDHVKPTIGLRLVAYDCQNVTWTGVREVMFRNAETFTRTCTAELPPLEKHTAVASGLAISSTESLPSKIATSRIHVVRETSYPTQIVQLKCFYTYQPTVEEHTKRCLRGDFQAAVRLERKWHDFMMAQEEAGVGGAGSRRRRRRAREAQMMHADEEDGTFTPGSAGVGRRRRARSGGCAVM